MYRRIFVPLDGSSFAEAALPRALSLGARWNAALGLATVATVPLSGVSDFPQQDALERTRKQAAEYLSRVEDRIRNAGFDGEIHVRVMPAGNVPRSLVRHAAETGADLAIMTTHGRGPLGRAWLGSTTDSFVRRSSTPVLLVRPEEGAAPPDLSAAGPAPFRKVLVPLDGSEDAEEALRKALPLLLAEEAELILLRVVLDPSVPGDSPYLPHVVRDTKEHREIETGAREYLEALASELRGETNASVETRVINASGAAAAILDTLEEEAADFVALATAGRGGAARLLLGSVADKVVRGSPVPVLVYRTPDSE